MSNNLKSKDTYTYKEILLGLRPEFLNVRRQLEELKKYSLIDPKYIKDYYYFLDMPLALEPTPRLLVYVDKQQNKFIESVKKIMSNITRYEDLKIAQIVVDDKDCYPFNKKLKLEINPEFKEEFKLLAMEILNSNLVRKVNLRNPITFQDEITYPYITATFYILSFMTKTDIGKSSISYFGMDDNMCYNASTSYPLTQEHLDYIFSFEFPRMQFPEYYQNLIDSSNQFIQDIILSPEVEGETNTKLQINEDGKRLVLSRLK